MTREEAHKLVDDLFNAVPVEGEEMPDIAAPALKERKLPEGKRVIRTKSSGDRVYYIDEEKKTRQWLTNPEVLKSLGFELTDVKEVADQELLNYQMGSAIYKVDEQN